MKLFQENPIFETVKSKVIISLFEKVRLSVSISPRNLYNSLKSIKEKYICMHLLQNSPDNRGMITRYHVTVDLHLRKSYQAMALEAIP